MNYAYHSSESRRIATLYDLAKERTWNASKDLDWLAVVPSGSPICAGASPFCGYREYEALTASAKAAVDCKWHAYELSEILHGEQGALVIAAQLVQMVPTVEAKLFSSSQVFDEARHVEFFLRYIQEHVGEICPPSAELRGLLERAVNAQQIEVKLLTMQVVIESLAMAKFQRLKTTSAGALLKVALEYILKDEARHVSFGVELLRDMFASLTDEQRTAHATMVLDAVTHLANSLNAPVSITSGLGWNGAELRHHLRLQRLQDPSEVRAVFRQLRSSLSAIGLFTAEVEHKLGVRGLLVES